MSECLWQFVYFKICHKILCWKLRLQWWKKDPLNIWNLQISNCLYININEEGIYNNQLFWWFSNKEPTFNAGATGDMSSVPGSGRSPGGKYGNPLQYSCLEDPMARGVWWTIVHNAESQAWLKWQHTHTHITTTVLYG